MKMKKFWITTGLSEKRRTLRGRVFTTIMATVFLSILLFMSLVMVTVAFIIKDIGWGFSTMVSEKVAREISSQETIGRFGVTSLQELDPNDMEVQFWFRGLTGPRGEGSDPQDDPDRVASGTSPMPKPPTRIPEGPLINQETKGSSERSLSQLEEYFLGIFREDFISVTIKLGDSTIYRSGDPKQINESILVDSIRELPQANRSYLQRLRLWYYDVFDTSVVTPITDSNQVAIGYVAATLNHKTINLVGIALLSLMAAIGLIVILISPLILNMFARRIIKPLADLQRQMKAMSEGDPKEVMNHPIVLKHPLLEIANLVEARNRIVMRLKENNDLLEQQNAELEGIERDLKEKNSRLQEEIEERERVQAALVEANQAKSIFLARMSHEIRTPMNAIIGLAHLALIGNPPAKTADYIKKIKDAADNLLGIINDILDFSKVEANKISLEERNFNLEEVFDSFSNLIVLKAKEKELEYMISIDPQIPTNLIGDPLRLSQILTNLATNAVKFTERGEVLINVEMVERLNNRVGLRFMVKDTGIGLSQDQIDILFEVFAQADESTTRKFGGTGLGLAICKQLVELMGGKIWVDSIPGKGSSFVFTTSFDIGTERQTTKKANWLDLRGLKVLVVDDNATAREVLAQMFTSLNLEVATASSGEEALLVLESTDREDNPYDLVIMDWKMPGLNGIETAHAIKSRDNMSKVPAILMVTAYDIEDAKTDEKISDIDGFMTKPVKPSVLLDTIIKTFNKEGPDGNLRLEPNNYDIELLALRSIAGAEVLLVEDNKINQQVASELLIQAGLNVTIADNGHEAIEMVFEKSFDLVFMDINMPEMDGIEATRKIRSQDRYAELPIIAMTANAMDGDKELSQAAGMNDHLTKPIDPDILKDTLIKWIKPRNIGAEYHRNRISFDGGETLPSLGLINTEQGIKNLGGNTGLYKKILQDFAVDNKDISTKIYNDIMAGDYKKAFITVHAIKGVAGNIAAISLYEAAAQLEGALRNESYDKIELLYVPFNEAVRKVLDELQVLAASQSRSPQPKNGDINREEAQNLINKLQPLLAEANAEAGDLIIEINAIMASSNTGGLAHILIEQIENMDFDEAVQTMNQICAVLDLPC